jgi:hypothetical protein
MDSFFVVAAVVIAGVVVLSGYLRSAARVREVARYADSKGWEFYPEKDRALDSRYPQFAALTTGNDRSAQNRFAGRWRGRSFVAFDYQYSTGSGKNRHTYRFSAVIVTSQVPLKRLTLTQENVLHRISAFFGMEDINFESAEFSRAFRVLAPDRRWAYDVCHPRAIELLLHSPRFNLDMLGCSIMAYRTSCFSPSDYDSAMNLVTGLLDALPDYVVQEQTGGAPIFRAEFPG